MPTLNSSVAVLHVVIDGVPLAGRHAFQALGANAALQAALGFGQRFLFGQGQVHLAEVVVPLFERDDVIGTRSASRRPALPICACTSCSVRTATGGLCGSGTPASPRR